MYSSLYKNFKYSAFFWPKICYDEIYRLVQVWSMDDDAGYVSWVLPGHDKANTFSSTEEK